MYRLCRKSVFQSLYGYLSHIQDSYKSEINKRETVCSWENDVNMGCAKYVIT